MIPRVPAEVFSPGDILSDELVARGWTPAYLAQVINRPGHVIRHILAGDYDISLDLAQDLSTALGTTVEFWISLGATGEES